MDAGGELGVSYLSYSGRDGAGEGRKGGQPKGGEGAYLPDLGRWVPYLPDLGRGVGCGSLDCPSLSLAMATLSLWTEKQDWKHYLPSYYVRGRLKVCTEWLNTVEWFTNVCRLYLSGTPDFHQRLADFEVRVGFVNGTGDFSENALCAFMVDPQNLPSEAKSDWSVNNVCNGYPVRQFRVQ